jgi:D-alanyl-D-alanine carboxypeptidase/D-alanyl-D-alanine-endopeptidase (penicillin-binding protein 4)
MRLLLVLLLAVPALAQPLQEQVERILRSTPAAQRALWGIKAVDAATGRTLAAVDPGRLFRPASNAKLFTAAYALTSLGPGHTLTTRVLGTAALDRSGRLAGDLILVGGADPSLSGQPAFRKSEQPGDPLQAVEDLAAQVAAAGVKRVDGDVIGDDTLFPWEPYPDGWTVDDSTWDYGAPVSALMVGDGALKVRIICGAAGAPPSLVLIPPVEYFAIEHRVHCGSKGKPDLTVERSRGLLRISGDLPVAGAEFAFAVDDTARYAAYALRDALLRRGIAVRGGAVARHRAPGDPYSPPQGVELARRTSPPMLQLLRTMNKVSQNQYAEILVRETARVRGGSGSLEEALEARKKYLLSIGIPETAARLADGSGLARQNLVTPNAMVTLLLAMHASTQRNEWLSLLPVGGVDGTLEDRFAGNPNGRRVRAKTGTLTAVSALSGYADRRRGGRTAFTIVVNNYDAPTSEIRALVDRIALLFGT